MDINKYIASGIIELYVTGLCSPEEKKELEMLRQAHPEIKKAVEEYEKEFEEKMQARSALPGEAADEKILHLLASLKPPVAGKIHPQRKVIPVWWKYAAAAAIALLLISSYYNFILYRKSGDRPESNELITVRTLPEKDYAVLKDPTITPVAMYGVGTHSICRCTMFWDKKTGKMFIMIHHLPLSGEKRDYQLWANVNGKMTSIGIIQDAIRDSFIELENVPASAASFIVTLEKAGGNNTPTEAETYLAGKI